VTVSHVFAGTGNLWIAVHVEPGEVTRQGAPPEDAPLPETETDVGEVDPVESGRAGGGR